MQAERSPALGSSHHTSLNSWQCAFRGTRKASKSSAPPTPWLRPVGGVHPSTSYLCALLWALLAVCLLHDIIDYHLCYPPGHLFLSLPWEKHPQHKELLNENTAFSASFTFSASDTQLTFTTQWLVSRSSLDANGLGFHALHSIQLIGIFTA